MTVFHPESFVPRTLNFNLTTNLFGFSVNAFEINARMEGVEMLLSKYFGSNGYFSDEYAKQLFKIPVETFTRSRRSNGDNDFKNIDDKVSVVQNNHEKSLRWP